MTCIDVLLFWNKNVHTCSSYPALDNPGLFPPVLTQQGFYFCLWLHHWNVHSNTYFVPYILRLICVIILRLFGVPKHLRFPIVQWAKYVVHDSYWERQKKSSEHVDTLWSRPRNWLSTALHFWQCVVYVMFNILQFKNVQVPNIMCVCIFQEVCLRKSLKNK